MASVIPYAAIAGCYIAIIALYVWVFKQIEGAKNMIHDHRNDADKHVDAKNLVRSEVCALQVKMFEDKIAQVQEDVTEVKNEVTAVKDAIHNGFSEVKSLIASKGG